MQSLEFVTRQALDHATFSPPPVDGSLSLPEIYEYNGEHSPAHVALRSNDYPHVPRAITWRELSFAVKRAAYAIRSRIEQSGPRDDGATVVGVLADIDNFTYSATIMGILHAGYQAFPLSPRQSSNSLAHLILQTRTKYLVVGPDPDTMQLVASACASSSLGGIVGDSVERIPALSFDDLFGVESQLPCALASVHPRLGDPALILHSSVTASSQSPRLNRMSHLALLQWGLHPYYGEADMSRHTLSVHALHNTHALSIASIAWMAFTGLSLAGFAPGSWEAAPDADTVLCSAGKTGSSVLLCVPALLEGWARRPMLVQMLKGFDAVVFTGSTLRKKSGEHLWKHGVRLVSAYSTTALGFVTPLLPTVNDPSARQPNSDSWNYFKFSPNCIPKMIPRDGSVYHLLFSECDTHALSIFNVESNDVRYYDTHDLLVRHPTDPDLWRMYGRTDSIIMHSNSHKTNPAPIEEIISRHHMITSCLVFGHGKRFLGVLVQPSPECLFDTRDPMMLNSFLDHIWPIVEEANQASADYSRIAKDMILVARPFQMTAKMTVDRESVLREYEQDIDDLYSAVDPASPMEKISPAVLTTLEVKDAMLLCRLHIEKYLPVQLAPDDDLFQAGCDSLQATSIRNSICNVLHYRFKLSTRNIPYNVVYTNPSIHRLGIYLANFLRYGHASVALCTTSGRIGEMGAMVQKYASNPPFPAHVPVASGSGSSLGSEFGFEPSQADGMETGTGEGNGKGKEVVLLTGSTGALGSHLLDLLVKDPEVAYVYALNRRDSKGYRSVYIRQATGFKDRDLDYGILNSEKLQLLEGDLCEEWFGLGEEVFEEMRARVTLVIHNSWTKNWGTTLPSLEPLIAGTRRLIDFALSCRRTTPPPFVFVSTLTYMNWQSGQRIPEAPNLRPMSALGIGYTESKWIAENILLKAAEETTLPVSIIRVGQLSGGPNGSWNPKEWLPALVRSAEVVRCLPNPSGVLAWIPVHAAAAAILEMRHSPGIMNLAHPSPVPAGEIFSAFSEALQVPLVEYSEWLIALEASIRSGTSIACLSLLDFYRGAYRPAGGRDKETCAFGVALAEMSAAVDAAPSLRSLSALGAGDVDSWIGYWRRIGLLGQR